VEWIATTILGAMLTAVIGACTYLAKKIIVHDSILATMQERIAGIQSNCLRHQEWQEGTSSKLNDVRDTVIKIAAKLNIE